MKETSIITATYKNFLLDHVNYGRDNTDHKFL
jgi:hypothetical protein